MLIMTSAVNDTSLFFLQDSTPHCLFAFFTLSLRRGDARGRFEVLLDTVFLLGPSGSEANVGRAEKTAAAQCTTPRCRV